jgi:hypothetical protein
MFNEYIKCKDAGIKGQRLNEAFSHSQYLQIWFIHGTICPMFHEGSQSPIKRVLVQLFYLWYYYAVYLICIQWNVHVGCLFIKVYFIFSIFTIYWIMQIDYLCLSQHFSVRCILMMYSHLNSGYVFVKNRWEQS